MKHPNPVNQNSQKEFLKNCPENERAFHERMFRIGNAAYVYHALANSTDNEALQMFYSEWLEGLPEKMRKIMKLKGFEECKSILSFTRYVNERKDVGMNEWLKLHLSNEDFEYWQNHDRV